MAFEQMDSIEEWFDDVVAELPPFALLDLLEHCIRELGGEGPTLH